MGHLGAHDAPTPALKKGSAKLPTLNHRALWMKSPKAPGSFDTKQILGSTALALLDSGDPASHLSPEHFRQLCQKCSICSKSEIEAPRPGLPLAQRNFQSTKYSPICGQYLCKHRAKISFAHLQGHPLTPMPPAGGSCGLGRTEKGGT